MTTPTTATVGAMIDTRADSAPPTGADPGKAHEELHARRPDLT